MALGILSRTCTSPGLTESTRVREKFSPVTIKQLSEDPTLFAHFSKEIEWLASTSSESEHEGEEQKSSHGAQGNDKLNSGNTVKLTSRVPAPQRWPHSHMSLVYVHKDRDYDELTMAEFITGYASTLQLKTT